jgi:hypothetical protein
MTDARLDLDQPSFPAPMSHNRIEAPAKSFYEGASRYFVVVSIASTTRWPQHQLSKATLRRSLDRPQMPSTLKAEIVSVVRMFETLDVIIIGRQHCRRVRLQPDS